MQMRDAAAMIDVRLYVYWHAFKRKKLYFIHVGMEFVYLIYDGILILVFIGCW